MLVDQAAALERIETLVDAEEWRADKRAAWSAMLRALAYRMDWETGLVTAVTRDALAQIGGVGVRTVSAMLAWAQHMELLAVVEVGAAGSFLGADVNRAPTYVFTTPAEADSPSSGAPVEGSCNLPTSYVKDLTLENKPLNPSRPRLDWPLWQVPTTGPERSTAAATLAARVGLDPRRCPMWRLRALLACWWAQGACVAGLLHAVDHHPDQADQARGDALRGARDPLRVLGHRLRPWQGRLAQLPGRLHGLHGDYRTAQAERLHAATAAAEGRLLLRRPATSSPAVRAAARAELTATLADHGSPCDAPRSLALLRSSRTDPRPSSPPHRRPPDGSR